MNLFKVKLVTVFIVVILSIVGLFPTINSQIEIEDMMSQLENIGFTKTVSLDNNFEYILEGTIVTMEDINNIITSGYILIRNGIIEDIWEEGESPPEGIENITLIKTNGYIFPGLIDGHNHLFYNNIPIWNLSTQYSNRYEWQASADYKPDISYPKAILTESGYANLKIEVVKYAEIKALIGGVTSIQGAPSDWSAYTELLVRNIEHTNFGEDKVITQVSSVENWNEDYILSLYNTGELDALFGHIGEGTDSLSHSEFGTLKSKGLLIEPLVAIHSVAFEREDFSEIADVGAKMIWSPTSNLLLYGDTADVKAAWEEGVCVGLAPDWSPSGPKNTLGSLKVADQWNINKLDGFFSDFNLIEMVTTNPAKMCGWESKVGKIKEGYYADLLVIDKYNDEFDPYRSLINAIDFDVKLVIVDGDPLYGILEYMELLKHDDFEIINFDGWPRAIDITKDSVYLGDQLYSDIRDTLEEVMTFSPEILHNYFNKHMSLERFTEWLEDNFPGLHSIPLDPIETYGDEAFFNAIQNSENFNSNFSCDISQYYERRPEENNPPEIPVIEGPKNGKTGQNYSYTITSIDPNNDEISYLIDWGDSNPYDWTRFRQSGDSLIVSYRWDNLGLYTIRVKAKDTSDLESNWATLKVTMPKEKSTCVQVIFDRFIERFPILETILSIW